MKPQTQEYTQPSAPTTCMMYLWYIAVTWPLFHARAFRSECVEVTRGKQLHYPVDILTWFGWPLLSPHYVSLVFNIALIRS